MVPRRRAAAAVSLLLCGCGRLEAPGPVDIDPAARFFDPHRVLEVKLELPQASWDELRSQLRSRLETLEGDCLAEPFENPFTYFRAAVEIDGERRDNVGVRKKSFLGGGSLDASRPGLKVHFDEYEEDGHLFGLDHLTLNNSRADPAYIGQCLSYQTFAAAGVAAPRCNFVHLVVQTEAAAHDLGLYVHVESVDKDFLARHFDDEDGDLFKGTLSDFREGFTWTFDPQTPESDRGIIDEMVKDLDEGVLDPSLKKRLEKHLDLDKYLTYWATEVLLLQTDGYANNRNNFFIYRERGGRLVFIPWDTENSLRNSATRPTSVFARTILPRRLYLNPETQALYVARMKELLDTVWKEPEILAEVDRMEALITPVLARHGGDVPAMRASIATIREVVRGRRAAILAEMSPRPVSYTASLAGTGCHFTIGRIASRVSTTFGTTGTASLTGTGEMSGTLNGQALRPSRVGGTALASGSRVNIVHAAQMADGDFISLTAPIDRSQLAPGTVLPLDFFSAVRATGTYTDVAPGRPAQTFNGVQLVVGTLTVEQGAPVAGAPVVTRMEGVVIGR